MKKLLLFICMASLSITACKKDKKETVARFEGNWEGVYTGGEMGAISISVDANGSIKGSTKSGNESSTSAITGSIDAEGNFNGSTEIGTTFTGKVDSDNVLSGNWTNSKLKLNGDWAVYKK